MNILKGINEGVFIITSHLIITLAVLVVYTITLFNGDVDPTLQTVLTVIVGYWFGSMGLSSIKGKKEEKKE